MIHAIAGLLLDYIINLPGIQIVKPCELVECIKCKVKLTCESNFVEREQGDNLQAVDASPNVCKRKADKY